MFNKFKQLKEIKDLQKAIAKERVEVEKKGIRVVLNGKMELIEVVLNQQLSADEQQKFLKDCFNEAVQAWRLRIAKKVSGIPGMG